VFIAVMASLKGASFDAVVEALKSGLRPMVEARMSFWPVAALISFTVIPPKHRVMYNNLLGMTWVSHYAVVLKWSPFADHVIGYISDYHVLSNRTLDRFKWRCNLLNILL